MRRLFLVTAVLVLAVAPSTLKAQEQYKGPIIDMHLHAFEWSPEWDYRPPFWLSDDFESPLSTEQLMDATFVEMKRLNIVKGWASGPLHIVSAWKKASPKTILAAPIFQNETSFPNIATLRQQYEAGSLDGLGELVAQLAGLTPSNAFFEPYYALAEELDIPTAIHTGFPPPGSAYTFYPRARASLGSPFGAEDALVRHPDLRVYIMHGGYPFLEDTIAFLHAHPQVYVDIAEINWVIPRQEFHQYLRRLMTAGFGKRLMYGSDQMYWPSAIEQSIDAVDSAPFLTDEEKYDIFYGNAARFLRLSEEEIAKHRDIVKE